MNPLLQGAYDGDLKRVKDEIESGENPNCKDKMTGITPLHAAASCNYVDIVAFLLENGADPSLETKKGRLAIDDAVERCYVDIAELLLAKGGFDIKSRSHLMEYVVRMNYCSMARWLIDKGVVVSEEFRNVIIEEFRTTPLVCTLLRPRLHV
jgi:hypothetical protein